jgi:hypothetical protein
MVINLTSSLSDAYLEAVHHKAKTDKEGSEEDRSTKMEAFLKPLNNPVLWSALHHAQDAPFVHDHVPAFGFNQPSVRRAAWLFLAPIVRDSQGMCAIDHISFTIVM